MQDKTKLLTKKQVADYFDVTPKTVYRWIREGRIKPEEVVKAAGHNGKVRIKESAIDRIVRGE